eukprot:865553-Pleurochrysis_carterae.AAC.2
MVATEPTDSPPGDSGVRAGRLFSSVSSLTIGSVAGPDDSGEAPRTGTCSISSLRFETICEADGAKPGDTARRDAVEADARASASLLSCKAVASSWIRRSRSLSVFADACKTTPAGANVFEYLVGECVDAH